MKKLTCVLGSVEEAEHIQKTVIKLYGGDCSIKEEPTIESNKVHRFFAIPSNFGMNNAPQNPADIRAWQISNIDSSSDRPASKCTLTYIGFEEQTRNVEAMMYNIHAENIHVTSYPRG